MTTGFRALCAELLEAIEPHLMFRHLNAAARIRTADRLNSVLYRARVALAEQPVGPTDEELLQIFDTACLSEGGTVDEIHLRGLRAVLAHWGQPAAAPVPVSERLPEPGEWVWHCYAGVRFWEHGRYNDRQFFIGDGPESKPATHWLPAHALPVPGAEESC